MDAEGYATEQSNIVHEGKSLQVGSPSLKDQGELKRARFSGYKTVVKFDNEGEIGPSDQLSLE